METKAEWSDTPPGQVGPTFVDEAAAEDDAKNAPDSTGLSDVVGEIDLHPDDVTQMEQEFLHDSENGQSGIQTAVSIQQGMLPTNLPPGQVALDHRVTVPIVVASTTSNLTSNDLQMTSNDLNTSTNVTQSNPAGPIMTSSDIPTTVNDLSKPITILTPTKPSVFVAAKPANMPTLTPPLLIGHVSDYAISIPVVAKWKYIPNPPGIVRLPFHGLEHQVRHRLIPQERTNLQMSAHRNDSYLSKVSYSFYMTHVLYFHN